MFAFVPVFFFIVVYLIFIKSKLFDDCRSSFLAVSVAWGALLTVITEFLSQISSIGFPQLIWVWSILSVVALCIYYFTKGKIQIINPKLSIKKFSRIEILLLAGITFSLFIIGLIAIISPPNTWDSMTYHMSRVAHWVQNKNISFYPTAIDRQLYSGPWAEYAILHFQILSNSDRLANLIQWFSMIGSLLGVSIIAKQLGTNRLGQIIASVFCVTLPMGILQGSSTQTDYVVSFWLICFVYFAILLKDKLEMKSAVISGLSLGLAILTKSTAYIFAFPFMIWICLSIIRKFHVKGFWYICLLGLLIITLNLGQYARNYDFYRSPIGPSTTGIPNEVFNIKSLSSNLLRNSALHIGTPFKGLNTILESIIVKFHEIFSINMNDVRTTFPTTEFHVRSLSAHEDGAGNPFHLIIIFVTIPILLGYKQICDRKRMLLYLFSLLFGAIIFSFYLKWQPWGSRLQLPFFVLWSPLIGILSSNLRIHKILLGVITFLQVIALVYLFHNTTRPIIGEDSILRMSRPDIMFISNKTLKEPYETAADFIIDSKCKNIGLVIAGEYWEYPFWVLFSNPLQPVRIEHVLVSNVSGKIYNEGPYTNYSPCLIMQVTDASPNKIILNEIAYDRVWRSIPITIYQPK